MDKQDVNGRIKQKLEQNHACYVLITCDQPAPDGSMNVSMSYSGDHMLASYLVRGAQTYLDEQIDEQVEEETLLQKTAIS